MKEAEHPMKLLQNIGDTGDVVTDTIGVQKDQLFDFTLNRFQGIQMYLQYIFTTTPSQRHGHKQIYYRIRLYRINQIYLKVYVVVEPMTVLVLVLVITTI